MMNMCLFCIRSCCRDSLGLVFSLIMIFCCWMFRSFSKNLISLFLKTFPSKSSSYIFISNLVILPSPLILCTLYIASLLHNLFLMLCLWDNWIRSFMVLIILVNPSPILNGDFILQIICTFYNWDNLFDNIIFGNTYHIT